MNDETRAKVAGWIAAAERALRTEQPNLAVLYMRRASGALAARRGA